MRLSRKGSHCGLAILQPGYEQAHHCLHGSPLLTEPCEQQVISIVPDLFPSFDALT